MAMWSCFGRRVEAAAGDPAQAVEDVFGRYSGDNGLMGPDDLRRFLLEVQDEADATKETAQQIIDSHISGFKSNANSNEAGSCLNLNDFLRYLMGDDNPPLDPSIGVHQDMNAPLSHYFIYTGHNSYLTGNQFSSESSDLPIIRSLRRGVRGIELDLWPNSSKTDAEVRHGRTLTTPVEFRKCLESIKEHAFIASPYPVIITLEDHLTSNLQAKVAGMLKEIFGDSLFCPTTEFLYEFPSPEDLKFRVLISTKPPTKFIESNGNEKRCNELQKKINEATWGTEVSDIKSDISIEHKIKHYASEHYQKKENQHAGDQISCQQITPEYKRLISITARKGKRELMKSLSGRVQNVTRLSLSELLFEKAVISHGPELIRFTQKNILRIYPKGTRVTSSNYNPLLGWMYGAQMVALNMQGYGRSLWLMHGFYRANGGCGYVKKPDFFLKSHPLGDIYDPLVALPVKKTLKVKVCLGDGWGVDCRKTYFRMHSPPVFYTNVDIVGVPADTLSKKTKNIEDWSPVWNEVFAFELRVPELALLRIKVHKYNVSDKDGFAGQTCLPVSELRPGIRAVPLFDRKGNKLRSERLLMHFQFV